MSQQQDLAVVVEYQIQNDDAQLAKNGRGSDGRAAYPNIYILPKRYKSMRDVKIAEVIRAFPLQYLGQEYMQINPHIGTQGKQKDQLPASGLNAYNNLHFRFETCVVNAATQKKITVYKDIVCNNGNLKELESIPVPIYKDQIRVKVLKMPNGNESVMPPIRKQFPRMGRNHLMQVYRHELGASIQAQNTKPYTEKAAGGGLMENIQNLTSGVVSGLTSDKTSAVKENVQNKAQDGLQKLSNAAKDIGGALGNFGAQIFNKDNKEDDDGYDEQKDGRERHSEPQRYQPREYNNYQQREGHQQEANVRNLNFSDDEDQGDGWNQMPVKQSSGQVNNIQQNIAPQPNTTSQQSPQQTFNIPQYSDAPPQQQQTDLLFGDSNDKEISKPVEPNQKQNQQSDLLFTDDIFGNSSANQPDPPEQQDNDVNFNKNDLMTGLEGLNFNDFGGGQQPSQEANLTNPFDSPAQQQPVAHEKTRTEELREFFDAEEQRKQAWENSAMRLQAGIDAWVGGGAAGPAGMNQGPAYLKQQKNHLKVLLGTLHQILWTGNTWQVIGMDKMADPKKVKVYYRKAILMCHPDKISSDDDPDKVYIANRCYAALNDAWNEYRNEPRVNV